MDDARLKETQRYATSASAYSASISPNGNLLVWGGEDNYMHVCDAHSGEEMGAFLSGT